MLNAKREPRNPVDKPHRLNGGKPDSWLFNQGKKRKVCKTLVIFFFFFFGGGRGGSCDVIIKRKPVSLGDGEQTQVLCELTHPGCKLHIEILKKEPVKLEENYMK